MRVADFSFELPESLIAHYPQPERSSCRLLSLDGPTGALTHGTFTDLLDKLNPFSGDGGGFGLGSIFTILLVVTGVYFLAQAVQLLTAGLYEPRRHRADSCPVPRLCPLSVLVGAAVACRGPSSLWPTESR